jgi:hemerythrin superfamily protein
MTTTSDAALDLGRPTSGDVVALIREDHRRLERLLAQLRDAASDRDAVRRGFADVLIAHGLAEEELVYPELRRATSDVDEEDVHHGHEEHAEGNQALLDVLELKGTASQAFDDAVEKLSNLVSHHIAEEELTILNPALEETSERVRRALGERWATRRNELIDAGCGSVEKVREIVEEADRKGLLDEEE